jgi:hypothetical protein
MTKVLDAHGKVIAADLQIVQAVNGWKANNPAEKDLGTKKNRYLANSAILSMI